MTKVRKTLDVTLVMSVVTLIAIAVLLYSTTQGRHTIERQNDQLRHQVTELQQQVRDLGQKPVTK